MAAASIGDAKKQRSAEGVDGWTPGPQALLLDVQGVLVDNGVALAGAVHTVREARRRGLAIRLLTNTATRHLTKLLQELRSLGFDLEAEELRRSPHCSRGWRARRGPGRAVDDRNRRFQEGGHWLLDAGAFLQALEYGASCEATVLGKPSAAFSAEVVQSLGLPAARCLMVGDDVEADVLGTIAAGLQGALVQTGNYRPGDELRLPQQAAVLPDVGAVSALLG